jgi:signal transduction histidine kinase
MKSAPRWLTLNCREAIPTQGNVWLEARNAGPTDAHGLAAGPYALITVSNDGKGLEEALGGRAFEPLTLPLSGTRSTGTELALSQVHGFCVQAGGIMRLTSTPGSPITVTMVLPAEPAPGRLGTRDRSGRALNAPAARPATCYRIGGIESIP